MVRLPVLALAALLAFFMPVAVVAQPAATATGLRISGSPADRVLIEALWSGYVREWPGLALETALHGPDSTIAGVYAGTADVALMARETREPMERMAFEWAMLSPPCEVQIATAGLEADRPNAQLAVFVHKDNPLAAISMQQLDAILSAERKRGGRLSESWDALPSGRMMQGRRIHLYGPPVDSVDALFIRRLVMQDSRKWSSAYHVVRDNGAVVSAVAQDRTAIGIAPWRLASPAVRTVPVLDAQGRAVPLNRMTAADRSYPLVRAVRMIIYKPKGQPIAPATADFVRFVLSPAGQAIIAAEGSYLPLPRALAEAELRGLD